ncbi:MAG TPA: hypothetical protein VNW53_11750 [Phenylobacterium sp.]|jgi:hypothetical protein|uniref:hypothetical protein n=1 Tax=Phenylobacterium sp. TaxID=1871053 RepID=UPI002BC9BA6F|nr:hypothetical protein [Phenylobacterium sp.]HXA39667.1 hypothetical protein [Phenylobacterium sp.]
MRDHTDEFNAGLDRLNDELAKAYGAPPQMTKSTVAGAFGSPKDDDEAPGEMISGPEFMAKALKAHKAGHITSQHLTTAELSINARKAPPPKIVKAVMRGEHYDEWG